MSENRFDKVTIRLHEGDALRLAAYYPRLGYNAAIRELVRKHLKKLDEKFAESGMTDALEVDV